MKETLIVIISGREGSAPAMRKTIRRHPERQRRIYTCGEEVGKASSEANVKDRVIGQNELVFNPKDRSDTN